MPELGSRPFRWRLVWGRRGFPILISRSAASLSNGARRCASRIARDSRRRNPGPPGRVEVTRT